VNLGKGLAATRFEIEGLKAASSCNFNFYCYHTGLAEVKSKSECPSHSSSHVIWYKFLKNATNKLFLL
jgi:hypothetical protein